MYGGIDSDGITERARNITSVMAGVAKRHAAIASCPVVMRELFLLPDSERRLFSGIDRFTVPGRELGARFEIELGSREERRDLSLSGALHAGRKTVRFTFSNDYSDRSGDRSIFLDSLELRNPAGRVVVHRELEELEPSGHCNRGFGDDYALWCNGTLDVPVDVPDTGHHSLSVVAWAEHAGDELPRLDVRVVEEDTAGTGAGARAVRSKLVELYDKLLGVEVSPYSRDIEAAYQLFIDALDRRRNSEENWFDYGACAWGWDLSYFDGILEGALTEYEHEDGERYPDFDWDKVWAYLHHGDWEDPDHAARAWVAVLAYLLMDYRYLYL